MLHLFVHLALQLALKLESLIEFVLQCLPFGLADTYGEEWKLLKRHMTPAFSGPKVKKAAKAVNEVSNKMTQYVEESLKKGEKLELTTVIQQFAMTTIASVVFGIDINCFKDNSCAAVRKMRGHFFDFHTFYKASPIDENRLFIDPNHIIAAHVSF